MRSLIIISIVLAAPLAVSANSPIRGTPHPDMPADQYVVVFDRDFVRGPASVRATANSIARTHGAEIISIYDQILGGFYARMPRQAAEAIARSPHVHSVWHPGRTEIFQQVQQNPDWGLDRVDQRATALDNQYVYDTTGQGVRIYVLDTGVLNSHAEFGGRVVDGGNFVPDSGSAVSDCNGHGTHVAGIAAGSTWGVAKSAEIWSMRVITCGGTGDWDWAINALLAIIDSPKPPAFVVNFSFGSERYGPADIALADFVSDTNATVVRAAGNANQDACDVSPNVPSLITVAATNASDTRVSNSNYGACVDIFAPGHLIRSADPAHGSAHVQRTGTSMAAPFVAGRAALFIATHGFGPASVLKERITTYNATNKAIASAGSGSPHRIVYSREGLSPPHTWAVFEMCQGTDALFSVMSNGNFGPESEAYTQEIQRNSSSWPWQYLSGNHMSFVQVAGGSQFRLRSNYSISQGVSQWGTTDWITAPNCHGGGGVIP